MNMRSIAVLSAFMIVFTLAGCGKKSKKDSGSGIVFGDCAAFDNEYGEVKDAAEGPLLSISNSKAKPGETAEVTLSVKNADKKWTMCGLHIAFPDLLNCVLEDEEERIPKMDYGEAIKGSSGSVGKLWRDNLPEALTNVRKKSLFFTAMFTDNKGKDGDIVTFYFDIPADAKPGTVYDIDFYYSNTKNAKDMFKSDKNDLSFEKYAFANWQGGSITVE